MAYSRLFEAVLFQYDASDGRNCYGLNIIGRPMHIAQKCSGFGGTTYALAGLRRGFQHGGC
ncbi:hypothetical protein MPLSOD_10421 [Mesorhizobium sp. SOD10]|nr:hypothetical protein MPLSOD_10421 [Mesorhizobium sp. SOD10]